MQTPNRTAASASLEDAPTTVGDLFDQIHQIPKLEALAGIEVPTAQKDPVAESDLEHRRLDGDDFWKRIPAFEAVDRSEFLDHKFQNRSSVTDVETLTEFLRDLVSPDFLEDVRRGMQIAPMNMRLSPYVLSRIDWENPYTDPLRIQFIPVASTRRPDHPRLFLDSLHEQADSPTPGLVHRYPDKALFLPLDVCPVYCRFCTRSYAIGGDTGTVEKVNYRPVVEQWEKAFAYLASRSEIEDVVISGGDAYHLPPARLKHIGHTILSIPHIRRIRFATKGPAVMPMKILTHKAWTDALVDVVRYGRERAKEVALHTHFNSHREITDITREAMTLLFKRGVKVRNQSVCIRGVNDDPISMSLLVKRLSYINVQPYYVYQHDMVKGVEDLRTRLADTLEVERHVRGTTAGFNTPTFVTDVPGGGGKRDAHSYDHYDETTGVSVYRSPSVDREKVYLYFDPIHLLPEAGRRRWRDPAEHRHIVREAVEAAGLSDLEPAVR
jgi:lysine 2,3-aminomutase